jgi:DNA-binding CsgD family transcriptional regulator
MVGRWPGDESCLGFLEAAYAWERPDGPWLLGVMEAAARVWGGPHWVFGVMYDASDITRFRFEPPLFLQESPLLKQSLLEALPRMPPDMVGRIYRRMDVGFGRPEGGLDDESVRALENLKTAELFAINGLDPSGRGCMIGLGAEREAISDEETSMFRRLASHLASAYRCRRRLTGDKHPLDSSDAVLGPDGKVLHAREPAAAKDQLKILQRAAVVRRDARAAGHTQPVTDGWVPRIQSRWTLVDIQNSEGDPCVIARENQASVGGLEMLTDRERQVVASAALGRSNKEIAYEIGIADATVRVLMSRACSRLGVSSRKELMELPFVTALRGE